MRNPGMQVRPVIAYGSDLEPLGLLVEARARSKAAAIRAARAAGYCVPTVDGLVEVRDETARINGQTVAVPTWVVSVLPARP